jgi:hypothetical protein
MKQLSQWRTFAGLLALGAMMVLSLLICRNSANGPALLPSVITGLGGLGLWLAGKAAKQHHDEASVARQQAISADPKQPPSPAVPS